MSKALKIAGAIVGVVSVIATAGASLGLIAAGGTLFGIGVSASTLMLVGAGLTLGSSLLAPKPKAPTASAATTDRLFASINARANRVIWLGSTAGGTDIRDQEYTNNQEFLHRFIVVASHRVQAIKQVWFDDKLAWTSTGGAQGEFAGYLTITPILEGSAANAINISPRMGSSRRFSGCAYIHVRYKLTGNSKKTESPFAQSIPSRITVVGDGALMYDPRLDSTAGGSGPQRANDQTTWAWSDSAARNPALQTLWYLLGWRIKNPVTNEWKLAVGKGIPPARIDIASFITGANLCDELVARAAGGTEPRYRGDGVFTEGDDPSLVLDNLKATMNAVLDDVDGKIRLTVLHNDLGTPRRELMTDDVLGAFTWAQSPSLSDTFNVIRGTYTDPSTNSLFQQIDYPEVRIASPDGIDRIQTVNLPLVQSASQAQRLVKQRLQRQLYPGTFQADFQATAWQYQKGDIVPFTFKPLGWTSKLFRIVDMKHQINGTVPMTLREEHPDIYLWDANDAAPVQGAAPTSYDRARNPIVLDIADLANGITAAQEAANDALDELDLLANDGWLTVNEKITKLVPMSAQLAAEFGILDAQAATLANFPSVVVARATASAANTAWLTYRNALSPAWNNTVLDTAIVRTTFNGKINDLRFALDTLADALRQAAATVAGWSSGAGIYDPMDYTTLSALGETWAVSGPGEVAIGATTDTGGLAVQLGDGNGSDSVQMADRRTLPFSPEDLYEVTFDFEVLSAGAGVQIYLGVIAQNAAGANLPGDVGSYCYVAAQGVAQSSYIGRRVFRGYMRGTAAPGAGNGVGGGAPDPAAPSPLPTGTVKMAGVAIGNYTPSGTGAGSVKLHEFSLRKVVDNTVVATGAWSSTRTYYRNEGVTFGGRFFGSKADGNLNHQPPGTAASDTYWYLIGDKGADGAQGIPGAPGANGQTSYFHVAYADSADGTVNFTTGAPGTRAYIGVYVDFTAASSGSPGAYTWSKYKGADGATGTPGAPGANGQASYVHFAYANSADGTSGFSTTDSAGKAYIGAYADFTPADSTNPALYSWSLIKGADGAGVMTLVNKANTVVEGGKVTKVSGGTDWNASAHSLEGYPGNVQAAAEIVNAGGNVMVGLNDDPDTSAGYTDGLYAYVAAGAFYAYLNGAGYGPYGAAVSNGQFVFARRRGAQLEFGVLGEAPRFSVALASAGITEATKLYFDTSLHGVGMVVDSCSLLPLGADGLNGSQGIPGAPGSNGQTTYVHFAYADSADGTVNFTTGAAGGRYYVGVYTDFTPADSGSPGAYTWSLQRGADGSNGTPGAPGSNGQPSYVHIAYANNASGTVDFSVSDPTGRIYIGVYTDFTLADSTNPALYSWSLIKGADGAPGAPGVSPISLELSVYAMDVAADANNVTKGGQLPKGSVVSLKQGTTTLTPSSVGFTYSDGGGGAFAADYGVIANTVRLTTANAPGWIDVNVVYAGLTYTKRIAISRTQDPQQPPSQTSAYTAVVGGDGSGATTYTGAGILSPELVLNANGSGQIAASASGEYYTDQPGGSVRTLTVAMRIEIAPQSTGVFSAPLSESIGSQAFWDKVDATPGIVSTSGTFTGLTPGAPYRIRVNTRKVSGSNPSVTIDNGGLAVNQ